MSVNAKGAFAAQPVQAARLRAPITDRVNAEPAILHGMSATEAKAIGLVSLLLFAIVVGITFAATRRWQALLLLPIFGPALALWFGSQYLARIKRGRPDGYYSQAIHLWLAARGLARPHLITHDGAWSLGRRLDLALSSAFEPPVESFSPAKPAGHSADSARDASQAP